jgi:AmiR/NasT family two-component response regulator
MAITTIIAGVLAFLLVVALGISYLIYVRMRDLQQELEQMKSRVELHDDELEQIESSLETVDL